MQTIQHLIDRLDGVVIVTTNLFENYDPALLRRIQRHIHFRLPYASMRRELFALHLPNPDRVEANYAVLAALSRGLSGGDILNVCLNALHNPCGQHRPEPGALAGNANAGRGGDAEGHKGEGEHSGERHRPKLRIRFGAG